MSPALAVLLAAALGANVRIETGIRTEARVRRLEPAPTPAEKDAVDLTANPHLNLGVTGGLGEFAASYSPRVTAADVGPDLRWEHLHEGDVRLKLAPGPIWSLEGFGSGGIGRTDLVTENRNGNHAYEQQRRKHAGEHERARQANREANDHEPQTLPEDHAEHVRALSAERRASSSHSSRLARHSRTSAATEITTNMLTQG